MKEHPTRPGYFFTEDGKIYSCWHKKSSGNNGIESYIDYNHPVELKTRVHPTNHYAYCTQGRLHIRVAETFLPNPDNLPEVNHKDKNKSNNHVSNLEWIDRQGNAEHGISKYYLLENIHTGEQFEVFNLTKFCRENSLHVGALHDTWKGRNGRKQHKGYRVKKCYTP